MKFKTKWRIWRISRTYWLLQKAHKWLTPIYDDYALEMDALITEYGRPYDRNKKRTLWAKLFEI